MTRLRPFGLALAVTLAACQLSPVELTSTPEPTPSPTADKPTPLPILPTPTPTFTPVPTATPLSSTATPEATPDPSATPDPLQHAGDVLFADTFDAETGWGLGSDNVGVIGLAGGQLTFTVNKPGFFRLSLWGGPVVKDAAYQVTARPALCAGRDEYALLFNVQDQSNYHRFSLTCDGLTQVARVQNGSPVPLKDFVPGGSIITGAPAENVLGVWSSGGVLRFFVNGVYLYSTRDTTFSSGVVGLYVRARTSESVSVSFDDLTVRAVNLPGSDQ